VDPWPLLENLIPNRSLAMLKLMLGLAMAAELAPRIKRKPIINTLAFFMRTPPF